MPPFCFFCVLTIVIRGRYVRSLVKNTDEVAQALLMIGQEQEPLLIVRHSYHQTGEIYRQGDAWYFLPFQTFQESPSGRPRQHCPRLKAKSSVYSPRDFSRRTSSDIMHGIFEEASALAQPFILAVTPTRATLRLDKLAPDKPATATAMKTTDARNGLVVPSADHVTSHPCLKVSQSSRSPTCVWVYGVTRAQMNLEIWG